MRYIFIKYISKHISTCILHLCKLSLFLFFVSI
nr:MAG TPA: hypothetical protein [Caudoviricetes sp.]